MPAFSAHLHPSRFLITVCVLLHVVTIALTVCYFDGWTAWLTVLILSAACVWAVYGLSLRSLRAINTVVVDTQERATLLLRRNSLITQAQLQGDSRVGRWLVCLHWHSGEGRYWQVILPDMTDAQSFRRLKVWAYWCQDKPATHVTGNTDSVKPDGVE